MRPGDANQPPATWRWTLRIAAGVIALVLLNLGLWGALHWRVARAYAAVAQEWRDRPDLPHPDRHALMTDQPVGEDNAAVLYVRAMEAMTDLRDNEAWREWDQGTIKFFPFEAEDLPLIRGVVTQDREALAFAREARRYPRVDWAHCGGDFTVFFPRINNIRELANRMTHRAAVAHHDADAATWLDMVLGIEHVAGAAIHYGPSVITGLVSMGCDAMACARVREGLQHVPPTLTREAWLAMVAQERALVEQVIARMLDDERHRVRIENAWRGEAAMQWATGRAAMPGETLIPLQDSLMRPVLQASLLMSTRWVDRYTTMPHTDYLTRQTLIEPALEAPATLAGSALWLPASIMMPTLDRADLAFYRVWTERRASAVLLAAALFEAEHGRLPETLDELVPGYLPHVPVDPFDPQGGPLRWFTRDGGVVWSVGQDGIDGGGDTTTTLRRDYPRNYWDRRDAVFFLRLTEHPPGEDDEAGIKDGPGGQQNEQGVQDGPGDE